MRLARRLGTFAPALLLLAACASGREPSGSAGAGELGSKGAEEQPSTGSSDTSPQRTPHPTLDAFSKPRFFFAGDGRLKLQHAHFNTTLDVRYRRSDGSYDPDALQQITSFFRSREDGQEGHVSLRLIELLDYVQDRYRPRTMTLISGYRSPAFNADLRAAGVAAAQTSLHTQGLAADVTLSDHNLKRVWQELRELRTGGVGYYRSSHFLHLDTGAPRFWEETTSRVSENLSADNARMFARTDFDRYATLDGAFVDLYSITTFPISIASEAALRSERGSTHVRLEPLDGSRVETRDGCFVITTPGDAHRFRVRTAAPNAAPAGRATLVLPTCAPRVGKTPTEVTSNPIEISLD